MYLSVGVHQINVLYEPNFTLTIIPLGILIYELAPTLEFFLYTSICNLERGGIFGKSVRSALGKAVGTAI